MTGTEDLLKNAKALKKEEKFEEAIKICEDLMIKEPENKKVREFYIELLFEYGYYLNDQYIEGYEKAVEIFDKILEKEPLNHKAIYNKGIAFFYMEKMENALTYFSKAIELKPDYKYPYYNIGLVHETIGDLYEALKYYRKALEIDPDFLYALHAKADVKKQINFLKLSTSEPKIDKNKLKDILEASKRVRISLLQEILNLKENDIDMIINWCKKYQFEIDGDFLVINKNTLPELINSLINDANI
ncbi:MAG: tetratricopeptide repeat protein [Promethearchaeota archaeon]